MFSIGVSAVVKCSTAAFHTRNLNNSFPLTSRHVIHCSPDWSVENEVTEPSESRKNGWTVANIKSTLTSTNQIPILSKQIDYILFHESMGQIFKFILSAINFKIFLN